MKQEVDQQRYIGSMANVNTRIITTLFDTDVEEFMSSETLFKTAMAEIQQRIITKIADILEPKILDAIIAKTDIAALVNEAAQSQVRAALFPKEK